MILVWWIGAVALGSPEEVRVPAADGGVVVLEIECPGPKIEVSRRTNPEEPASARLTKVVTPLQGYLASTDPSVRRRGVRNLAYRTDETSRRLLVRVVREDPDPAVRRFAWEQITDLMARGDHHMPVLVEVAGWQLAHGEPTDAIEAARALKGRVQAAAQLVPGLRRASAMVRLSTLDAMSALPFDRVRGLRSEIQGLLQDPDGRVARRARKLLADRA